MNRRIWLKVFLGAAVLMGSSIAVAAKPVDMWGVKGGRYTTGEHGAVVRVNSGGSLTLKGGMKVSLAGIQTPKSAWPSKGYKAWPMAAEAKAYLRTLTHGKTVQLYYSGDKRDRYGRALAQVWTMDEAGVRDLWVQEEMLKAGFARVHSFGKPVPSTHILLSAENAARTLKHGIWNAKKTHGFYAVRAPDPNALAQYVDSVQIVEGIVISTADVRGTIYLNFGSDYKTDFTIGVSKKSRRLFKTAPYDPLALVGAKIRVRGWIELQNGPMIWLGSPDRLEVLD